MIKTVNIVAWRGKGFMTPSSWVLWAVDSFPVTKSVFFEGMALGRLIMLQRGTRYPGVCAKHKLGSTK